MKDVNQLYPAINKTFKSPKAVLLTLTLTSLLSSGLGIAGNNSAIASSASVKQTSRIEQTSRVDQTSSVEQTSVVEQISKVGHRQISSQSKIQISQNTNQFSNILPRRIANAILRDASKRSDIPIRELQITQGTRKTFGNPCVFKFGEVCTEEFNPIEGWEVVVRVQDDSWTYHVNKSGSQIVLDPKVSPSQSTALPKEIKNAILRDASKRSKIPTANLKITKVIAKTFGNPCEFKFGEICTKEFNPIKGWEVVVQVDRQSWTYHVNESGSQLVLDPKMSEAKG
ncbi:hypothetical protein [Mastigocladopsis repens]|uniref:hypothetical protein n=1 Tax=Mastigocladopsis repens TaxID=221287 RepID=UPI0002DB62FC|nr:hypothetical protein [Mastigocladopsis repens]